MQTFIEKNQIIIRNIIILLALLVSIFLVAETVKSFREAHFAGSGVAATNTITVNGEGKVEKAPDTARISVTVQNENKDVAVAQKSVSDKIDTVTNALVSAGLSKDDITTDSYNSYPEYDYVNTIRCITTPCPTNSTPVLRDYQVSHQITIAVKDLTKVSDVLGILGTNGVTTIVGPNFGFADDKAVEREARDMAIQDAKDEAKKLTDSLGVHLGRIVSFNEQNNGSAPQPMYKTMDSVAAAAPSVSVPTGTQKVDESVTITYEIR